MPCEPLNNSAGEPAGSLSSLASASLVACSPIRASRAKFCALPIGSWKPSPSRIGLATSLLNICVAPSKSCAVANRPILRSVAGMVSGFS